MGEPAIKKPRSATDRPITSPARPTSSDAAPQTTADVFHPRPAWTYDSLLKKSSPKTPCTNDSSVPHALRPTDITKVNRIVEGAGYEPFSLEGTYFLNALCLKKTLLLTERKSRCVE